MSFFIILLKICFFSCFLKLLTLKNNVLSIVSNIYKSFVFLVLYNSNKFPAILIRSLQISFWPASLNNDVILTN